MNRITGLEKSQAPWHLRWFYPMMRKMFGKDLTPVKQQMRVPGMGQLAFENYRARLNRVFDVGSDELYKLQTNV